MKMTTLVTLGLCSVTVCHAAPTEDKPANPADRIAASVPATSKTGGILVKPAKGDMTCVASQSYFTDEELTKLLGIFSDQLRFPIALRQGEKFQLGGARQGNKGVAIYLADDPQLPMSLVAIEEKWAMVNVGKVISRDTPRQKNVKRLQREFSRVFKALFSAATTVRGAKAATCGADLDLVNSDPIDGQTLFNIIHGLPSMGLTPKRTTTYMRACQEGWAPQPTNDVQKAIWEKVHAIPKNPMKIEFDPKKGR